MCCAVVMRRRPKWAPRRAFCAAVAVRLECRPFLPSPLSLSSSLAYRCTETSIHIGHIQRRNFLLDTLNFLTTNESRYVHSSPPTGPSHSHTMTDNEVGEVRVSSGEHAQDSILTVSFAPMAAALLWRHDGVGCPRVPEEQLGLVPQVVRPLTFLSPPYRSHCAHTHSIASVSGDLSSLTAPPFILSPISLTEFPGKRPSPLLAAV
jgi:hypothetical protein